MAVLLEGEGYIAKSWNEVGRTDTVVNSLSAHRAVTEHSRAAHAVLPHAVLAHVYVLVGLQMGHCIRSAANRAPTVNQAQERWWSFHRCVCYPAGTGDLCRPRVPPWGKHTRRSL